MRRHGPFFMLALLLSALLLAGCVTRPVDRHNVPRHMPPAPSKVLMRQCTSDLNRLGAKYRILPDYWGQNGCSAINAVLLDSAGASITNLRATQCPLARSFAAWVRGPLQQAAREYYGMPVIRVETMGSFACRQVRGVASTNMSEHAYANAIDVGGFVLANGRRITVLAGWTADNKDGQFLRTLRKSACKQFQTVLTPDYNAAHRDHFHFDLGRGPYCR
jgi:hypothetical protein